MSVRIMYGRISILRSSVIVHMKVKKLVAGTLLPIGGHYCTHWEYLTSKAANPALVVSEWIRVKTPIGMDVLYGSSRTRWTSFPPCTRAWGRLVKGTRTILTKRSCGRSFPRMIN